MRKKLLRSRSGFEKPESREEAIMQNILGASNVLEPSESNIEEILKSILYNTPYTKEAEFEIEKILLAIKNNGTYDGEGESRDMKILIAILNDLDYTEETESRIEELFIEWLHQRSSIKVLEGVPPLTFTSRGLPLINYLIEGNTVQNGTPTPSSPVTPQETGKMTENLFDKSAERMTGNAAVGNELPTGIRTTVQTAGNNRYTSLLLSRGDELLGKTLTFSATITPSGENNGNIRFFWLNNKSATSSIASPLTVKEGHVSGKFTIPDSYPSGANGIAIIFSANYDGNCEVGDYVDYTDVMLNVGQTPISYEPYGVKIPISSNGVTTNVYLGETETTRQIKKMVLDGTENWTVLTGDGNYSMPLPSRAVAWEGIISTHFTSYELAYNAVSLIVRSARTSFESLDDFKQFLADEYAAGHPVTVWYVLSTPQTAVVNEPLRKIGDYTDSISMEQAGVQIPTNNGTTVIDVDTTLKPSNIYIEYK